MFHSYDTWMLTYSFEKWVVACEKLHFFAAFLALFTKYIACIDDIRLKLNILIDLGFPLCHHLALFLYQASYQVELLYLQETSSQNGRKILIQIGSANNFPKKISIRFFVDHQKTSTQNTFSSEFITAYRTIVSTSRFTLIVPHTYLYIFSSHLHLVIIQTRLMALDIFSNYNGVSMRCLWRLHS